MELLAQTYSSPSSGMSGALVFFYFVFGVVYIAAYWTIFRKAGEPGWAAIIPIYNIIILLKVVGRPWWWVLLLLIPIVNLVVLIIVLNDLSKSFGKGVGFTIGLIIPILSLIFTCILGFGSDPYLGPAGRAAVGGSGAPPPPPPPPPTPAF